MWRNLESERANILEYLDKLGYNCNNREFAFDKHFNYCCYWREFNNNFIAWFPQDSDIIMIHSDSGLYYDDYSNHHTLEYIQEKVKF